MTLKDATLRVLQASLVLVTLAALAYRLFWPDAFSTDFAREDGWVEYGTALGLMVAGIALIVLARKTGGYRAVLLGIYALAMFFGAGEEISWGQRIFGIESSQYFLENNVQGETNLHNLMLGEEQLASFVLGRLLTLIALLYLVVLPFVHPFARWARWIADALAVPVPAPYIAAIAVGWSLLVVWIDLPRNWEVYEFVFAAMLCMIFIAPVNRATFKL